MKKILLVVLAALALAAIGGFGLGYVVGSISPKEVKIERGDTYRVKVDFGYDKPVWGYVGVTSGWKPVFLLMRRRGQIGSHETLNHKCRILATKSI